MTAYKLVGYETVYPYFAQRYTRPHNRRPAPIRALRRRPSAGRRQSPQRVVTVMTPGARAGDLD